MPPKSAAQRIMRERRRAQFLDQLEVWHRGLDLPRWPAADRAAWLQLQPLIAQHRAVWLAPSQAAHRADQVSHMLNSVLNQTPQLETRTIYHAGMNSAGAQNRHKKQRQFYSIAQTYEIDDAQFIQQMQAQQAKPAVPIPTDGGGTEKNKRRFYPHTRVDYLNLAIHPASVGLVRALKKIK